MRSQIHIRSIWITYIRLGYLLHLMTIAELVCIYALFHQLNLVEWVQSGNVVFRALCITCLVCPPLFPQCDARSRFQNYKQVKDYLYIHGFQTRIIKPFSYSRCQRDAVITAAEELGMQTECQLFFKGLGYRWYHILPDFLFQKPIYLIRKEFWLNTFFANKYESKIDYKTAFNKIDAERITSLFKIESVI